jgi:hypothetical protein
MKPAQSQHLGRRFKILWQKAGSITLRVKNATIHCYGLTDTEKGTIRMEEGLRPSKEREVLVHEVLHQLLATQQFEWLDPTREEEVVQFLGVALGAHLAENPGLWTYLLGLRKTEK